ncbi:MAG: glycosyltransferase family 39 protein [Candidatus Polarisedimenticolia bacterium]
MALRSSRAEAARTLIPILAAGLAARLALIAWTAPLDLSLDEARFWDLAARGMEGTAFLPPLYPLVLAAFRSVCGDSVLAVRILTALLSLAGIGFVHRLGERHMGRGGGRVPAWLAALWPTLIYYDGRLRSESLVVLLLLGFAVLWTGPRTTARRPLLAGLVLGAAVLARPELLLLPPILALAAWRREGAPAAWGRAALLLPGLLVCVLPWSARNARVVGVWTPVSTNGGYNFWKSFNPQSDGSQVPIVDFAPLVGVEERDLDRVGYAAGWRYIAEHPVRSLLLAPAKAGHLLGPERDHLSDVRRGRFPRRSLILDLGFAAAQNVLWFLLLAFGLYALLGPSASPVKDVVLAVLINLVLVHLVFFGDDRFHVPLLPFLLAVVPEAWDGSLKPRTGVRLLVLLVAALGVFWIAVLMRDLDRVGSLWGG